MMNTSYFLPLQQKLVLTIGLISCGALMWKEGQSQEDGISQEVINVQEDTIGEHRAKNKIDLGVNQAVFSPVPLAGTSLTAAVPSDSKKKYECVMHPEVVSGVQGKCPKCRMKLFPKNF
jgi:hypothetical protein